MFSRNQSFAWCASLLTVGSLAFGSNNLLAASPANSAEMEKKLIAIMRSDAPPEEKAITCKRLAVYGGDDAVPVLAPLLEDPRLASWARVALEAIPGRQRMRHCARLSPNCKAGSWSAPSTPLESGAMPKRSAN